MEVIADNGQNFVFAGLGNPGSKYEMTRHNIGHLIIRAFAAAQSWSLKEDKKFNALTAKKKTEGHTVHLILPMTYMNLSGSAVKRYLDFYQLKPGALYVVSDDVSLPFGWLRLRTSGRPGGHNGLKSIEAYLGTCEYTRLRVGIGSPPDDQDLAEYVLNPFSREEQAKLDDVLQRGNEALRQLLVKPIGLVMNEVNMKPINNHQDHRL